uniref:Uncharacterized protein n=1 Tax=Meloidogyne incognita TaxID=6306 RepID=A0A914KNX5_MELIC
MTKRIDEAIIQMICTDIFPLSITDGPGFRNFLKVVAPKYVPKFDFFYLLGRIFWDFLKTKWRIGLNFQKN